MSKFSLNKEQAMILVIDIQHKLVPAMNYGDQVIQNTDILLNTATHLNMPIFATEQYPKGLGNTVEAIRSQIKPENILEKMTFSACTGDVIEKLRKTQKKSVIVAGMETHICVYQTVRDLIANGFEVFVVLDAVSSRKKENYRNGLEMMQQMGAVITNTETVFFDLLKEAGTESFKGLRHLIK